MSGKHKKKQRILLIVPYYSQHLDVRDLFWRSRSCGIVALAMAMKYLQNPKQKRSVLFSIEKLIREGIAMGAYHDNWHFIHDADLIRTLRINGKGWIHDGLVGLAKRHGFGKSFRKEWDLRKNKNLSKTNILRYIVVLLQNNLPVLASVKTKRGGHLILLVGFRYLDIGCSGGFFYHDPDARSRGSGAFRVISTARFLKRWKRRIIVVKK